MLHLVFKVSSTCSHTRLKLLSPLSNCFINYALRSFKFNYTHDSFIISTQCENEFVMKLYNTTCKCCKCYRLAQCYHINYNDNLVLGWRTDTNLTMPHQQAITASYATLAQRRINYKHGWRSPGP